MATLFNDKIYLAEALQAFTAELAPATSVFARDFSSATRRKGDAVIVPRISQLSTTTFAYANNSNFPYEGAGGTATAITVNLDNHQIVNIDLSDDEFHDSSAGNLANFGSQAGRALGKKVLQNIFALFTTGTFGTALTSLSLASLGRAAITASRTAMVKRDVPISECSLVANADLADVLLNDTNIFQAYSFGGNVLQTGKIPSILGMPFYTSNILPANGVSLVGLIVHPDSLAVAMRQFVPQDTSSYAAVDVMTDAASGITMTYRRHYNPGKGKHFLNVECLFGFAAGLTLGAGLITQKD